MGLDFGTGTKRTLDAASRQYSTVLWLYQKPPLSPDLTLMSQNDLEEIQKVVRSMMPSGFLLDPTRTIEDYKCETAWTNFFQFGNPKTPTGGLGVQGKVPPILANVNGWLIPVCGTNVETEGDLYNLVKLYPAPESDTRIDLVFLEAWQARVDANPSTVNKPSASTIWKYGNVQYGGINFPDDIMDPTLGVASTARVQIQYRIRVVGWGAGLGASVALDVYPDGLGDPNVYGQGTGTLPISGLIFSNMVNELGDPSLWRAGDGDPTNALGTVDGYTYAIPICAIFRRNSGTYVAVNAAGNPNQNGAFERTPGTKLLPDPLAGDRVLLTPSLTLPLSPTDGVGTLAIVSIDNLNGSGLEDFGVAPASLFMTIGDEIIQVGAIDLIHGTITIPSGGRGRFGTGASGHAAGATLGFYNLRPDGMYADEVTTTDILDLRRAVNAQEWDYRRLLEHNVASLAKGNLHSAWKKSGAGDTQGPVVHEVDYLFADGSTAVPNHTEALDGPDGIRTIFSDAATIQPNVTLLLNNAATQDANQFVGFTNDTLDDTVSWDVGPDFHPSAFMNVFGLTDPDVWTNGSLIFLYTGGQDGTEGARGTFRDGTTRAVRPLMPKEFWKDNSNNPDSGFQTPVTLRFLEGTWARGLEAAPMNLLPGTPGYPSMTARHIGPMYPSQQSSFTHPYIVLGAPLRSDMTLTGIPATNLIANATPGLWELDTVGIDFDTYPGYPSDTTKLQVDDVTQVANPLLRDSRTLYGMLTNGGQDATGAGSEVFVTICGDKNSRNNNGVFRVVGAGQTTYYTVNHASNSTSIVLEPLSAGVSTYPPDVTLNNVSVEFRSPYSNADDVSTYAGKRADLVLGMTDLGGQLSDHPWTAAALGFGAPDGYDLSIRMDTGTNPPSPIIKAKMVLDMSLIYHPGRGGMARVPGDIVRFAMKGGTTETIGAYLRQSEASVDSAFPAQPDETYWDTNHIQLWNRLGGLGLYAPNAPDYGGDVVGYTEQDREHEVFYDKGSKTLVLRPYRDRQMTLKATFFLDGLDTSQCLLGDYSYPGSFAKDALVIWTGSGTDGKKMGFPLPYEFMPRFGRQDIPYWQRVGTSDPFLPGINHLFVDAGDDTLPVFNIIGGRDNLTAGNEVTSFFFSTTDAASYGKSTTITGPSSTIPALYARNTTDINPANPDAPAVIASLAKVNSSDFGKGLKGIQLPPYYGIARLYGVYDARDYNTKGGRTFKANRYDVETDPAPNLLREDASKQTLFILQDGAKDLTRDTDDHTYIIPSNVLDITRALNYTDGDKFEDYHYIVECSVFGFSKGWINKNNFVLVRRHSGKGLLNTDGTSPIPPTAELDGVHMVIPCPAGHNDQFYVAYNRSVYQGDPYMSRSGDSRTTSDYEFRYGQISMGNQYLMRTPIQQFDSAGDFIPQMPNPKTFELLASMDFYTTLGTGKIGGQLYPGTILDVGHTEFSADERMPVSSSQPAWRVNPRTFTEGQNGSSNRASLDIVLLNNDDLVSGANHARINIRLLDGSEVRLTAVVGTPANEDEFQVDTDSISSVTPRTITAPVVSLLPGVTYTQAPIAWAGANINDTVVVNNSQPGVLIRAWVSAPDQISIGYTNLWTPSAFDYIGSDAAVHDLVLGTDLIIGGNASNTRDFAQASFLNITSDTVIVVVEPSHTASSPVIYAAVASTDNIQVVAYNVSGGPVTITTGAHLKVAILNRQLVAAHTFPLTGFNVYAKLIQNHGSLEATAFEGVYDPAGATPNNSLVTTINNHSRLKQTLFATSLGGGRVGLRALPTGATGNGILVTLLHDDQSLLTTAFKLDTPFDNMGSRVPSVTSSPLLGGIDIPINAGDGTTQLELTGMIERFPLGALLQDSDFLCEDPLRDKVSPMKSSPSGPRPVQSILPLTNGGDEYTRFWGESGEVVSLSDGSVSVLNFGAWTDATPTGTKMFRLYRGGGPLFNLSGDTPGGPIDWVSDTFPPSLQPVLKGGILACRAMLVKNYSEEVNQGGGPYSVSYGDEIQMIIATYGILGNGTNLTDGYSLQGIIGPAGYGEGYAAADRFRLAGKPMVRGFGQDVPDSTTVQVAVYPDEIRS